MHKEYVMNAFARVSVCLLLTEFRSPGATAAVPTPFTFRSLSLTQAVSVATLQSLLPTTPSGALEALQTARRVCEILLQRLPDEGLPYRPSQVSSSSQRRYIAASSSLNLLR